MARTPRGIIARELLRRKTPATRERLLKISGCENDREVRRVIEDLRRIGFPVISSPGRPGYWLARNEEELLLYKTLIFQKCHAEMQIHGGMAMYRIDEIREDIENGKFI